MTSSSLLSSEVGCRYGGWERAVEGGFLVLRLKGGKVQRGWRERASTGFPPRLGSGRKACSKGLVPWAWYMSSLLTVRWIVLLTNTLTWHQMLVHQTFLSSMKSPPQIGFFHSFNRFDNSHEATRISIRLWLVNGPPLRSPKLGDLPALHRTEALDFVKSIKTIKMLDNVRDVKSKKLSVSITAIKYSRTSRIGLVSR